MSVDVALTPVQRQRRQRILDAAVSLAAEGGYDAVQMREVAVRAEVALGTLYRYFVSKEHLLVSALAGEVAGIRERLSEKPPRGENDAERVMDVIRRSMRSLQRQPNVIAAMLKSLISTGPGVGDTVGPIGAQMTDIVVAAMRHDPATAERDRAVAQVIQQVWLASLLWWVAGRAPAGVVDENVARAVELLLGDR
ncbi:MAG TPA: TetR family transcriptional regulator [Candidatus Dormibacteraeota bacterium]|nr:TetR family transcriptional regulator [Candidatus Dormibacteraeota bacterium]